ncbi:hypothetical protein [Methanolobus sp. WCC4]|uniref:helix-turn-helix transcriptional regulator n=1 Tax=Methanolobus sp. WCC4 TaxID=3125784 RepID=UPI0030FA6CEA
MRRILFIAMIALLLLLPGVASADTATVHGVAYEWSTFEPLDNTIVGVNSTPEQSMVAKYGVYSFELPNGTYQITASYYEEDQLAYYAEDVVTVSDEGSYVLDLLLLPSYSSSGDATTETGSGEATVNSSSLMAGAVIVVIILLTLLVSQMKKRPQTSVSQMKKVEVSHPVAPEAPVKVVEEVREEQSPVPTADTPEEPADELPEEPISVPVPDEQKESVPVPVPSDEPVPADLQEILDILKSQGGRMTQKDMRKRLKYSEGKVSLMLLDLEKRGKIQKFKKGRGNVLFLVDQDE